MKGKKRGKRQKMEIKVTACRGERDERMIEGKRMIRGKRADGETARKEGRGKNDEERRGEVIGVCLCTYMFFYLYLTQLMLVQTKGKVVTDVS